MSPKQIFISTLAAMAGLATAYALFMSMRVVVILFIAIIIASSVRPLILRMIKLRVPAAIAFPTIYAGILFFGLILSFAVLPPVINQVADYLQNDWRLASRIIVIKTWAETKMTQLTDQPVVLGDPEEIRTTINDVVNTLRTSAPEILDDVGGALGEIALVIVMGIYWMSAREKSIDFVTRMVSSKHRENTRDALLEIEESMGAYVRGVAFVALFIGMSNFIVLSLFQIPNAATLGFIIGITTVLPVIGGFIGGGLAILLAMLASPLHGLIVFGVFVVLQQIEANYLTPRTMARSVGVDPLLVMLSIFVGFALYGVIGAIIAVPILSMFHILIREFVVVPRQEAVANYALEQGIPVFKKTSEEGTEPIAPATTP